MKSRNFSKIFRRIRALYHHFEDRHFLKMSCILINILPKFRSDSGISLLRLKSVMRNSKIGVFRYHEVGLNSARLRPVLPELHSLNSFGIVPKLPVRLWRKDLFLRSNENAGIARPTSRDWKKDVASNGDMFNQSTLVLFICNWDSCWSLMPFSNQKQNSDQSLSEEASLGERNERKQLWPLPA